MSVLFGVGDSDLLDGRAIFTVNVLEVALRCRIWYDCVIAE